MQKVRFGVIGTNFITDWLLTGAFQDPRFELTAVYSRSADTAAQFSQKYSVPYTFTSLEQLAQCDKVDAVYIASPNALHAQQSILMMQHGKHVLCEKPLAMNVAEAESMFAVARNAGVSLMEAMKPTLTPNFKSILDHLSVIGKVRQYFASFCQYSSRYDRFKAGELLNAFNPELGSGALRDIGVYTLYPLVVLFGKPLKVIAKSIRLSSGIDGVGSIILEYPDFLATVMYSKVANAHLPAQILGEEGTLVINRINHIQEVNFIPRKNSSADALAIASDPAYNGVIDLTRPTTFDEYYYEVKEFIDLIVQGRQESDINSWNNSRITLEIIDSINNS
jgi:predicted dehydrogenase